MSKTEKNEGDLVTATLRGIHDDIESLWNVHMSSAGEKIESLKDSNLFPGYYIISQDYFTFYNANAAFLGRIKDDELRKSILKTYANLKSLADTCRTNNEFLRKYEATDSLHQATGSRTHEMQAGQQLQILVSYAKSVKGRHSSCKDLVQKLLKDLQGNENKRGQQG